MQDMFGKRLEAGDFILYGGSKMIKYGIILQIRTMYSKGYPDGYPEIVVRGGSFENGEARLHSNSSVIVNIPQIVKVPVDFFPEWMFNELIKVFEDYEPTVKPGERKKRR
jgi:hypothetical protein